MGHLTKLEKILAVVFLLSVPLVRPWVHGDGRGYYAFARALLLQHNLDFNLDWYKGYETDPQISDPSFRQKYLTANGHINNHWTIGPAILWSPFLLAARAAAVIVDTLRGTHLAADGFSLPYRLGVALGTFFYGFLTLLLSMRFAARYVPESWAFLATVAIWLASSFTYYLYLEPSFAHIISAFLVALFVYLWDGWREQLSAGRGLTLGLIAGLMLDTYYPNIVLLVLPACTFVLVLRQRLSSTDQHQHDIWALMWSSVSFAGAAFLAFLPTLITKQILYGNPLASGYKQLWFWYSPAFFKLWFSSHGVFSWTPLLLLTFPGLLFLRKAQRNLAAILSLTLLSFLYFIGCYQDWHAIPSFGNRFFISLSVIFVLGIAAFLSEVASRFQSSKVFIPAFLMLSLFVCWNFGLMLQFAAHLFPQTGDVSWAQIARNQVSTVPVEAAKLLKSALNRHSDSSAARVRVHVSPPETEPVTQ